RAVFNQRKDAYHQLLRLLPLKGRFLHLGCGYGVLDFLLVYDSALRQVIGWDARADRVAAARNTYTVNRYPLMFVDDQPSCDGYDVLIVSADAGADWSAMPDLPEWVVLEDAPAIPTLLTEHRYRRQWEATGLAAYRKTMQEPNAGK